VQEWSADEEAMRLEGTAASYERGEREREQDARDGWEGVDSQ